MPDHEFIVSWQFNECQLDDLHLVRDLVDEIDAGEVDVLYRSWCLALEFVNDPAIWAAIESVADTLGRQWLSAIQVENLSAGAFWNTVVITSSVARPNPVVDVSARKYESW